MRTDADKLWLQMNDFEVSEMSLASDLLKQVHIAHSLVLSEVEESCRSGSKVANSPKLMHLAFSLAATELYEDTLTVDGEPRITDELMVVLNRWHQQLEPGKSDVVDRAKAMCQEFGSTSSHRNRR